MRSHRVARALLLVGVLASAAGARGEIGVFRELEPVLVPGADLASLRGALIDRLGLFALAGGALVEIPFQIDERDPDGNWVMTAGLEAGRDDDEERLDANDELVFMARDAGPRAPGSVASRRPPGVRATVEIEIADPVTGGSSFVYLRSFDRTAPRSPVDYVTADPATDSVEAQPYGLTFSTEVPVSWAFLTVKDLAGKAGGNLIDRIKLRASAMFIFGLIEWEVNEEQFQSVPIGYRDGAVRVLRRVENHVELGMGIESPRFHFDTVYYRNSIFLPSTLFVYMAPNLIMQDLQIRTYVDLRARYLEGWTVHSHQNPDPVTIDGSMSEAEHRLDLDDPDWLVVRQDEMAFVSRILVDPRLLDLGVRTHLLYLDDVDVPDPPEAEPGNGPSIGFHMTNFDDVPAGTYSIGAQIFLVNDYRPGLEAAFIEGKGSPLRVTTRPLR